MTIYSRVNPVPAVAFPYIASHTEQTSCADLTRTVYRLGDRVKGTPEIKSARSRQTVKPVTDITRETRVGKIRIFEADCQHLSAANTERASKQTRGTSMEHEGGLSRPRCVLRITTGKDRSIYPRKIKRKGSRWNKMDNKQSRALALKGECACTFPKILAFSDFPSP